MNQSTNNKNNMLIKKDVGSVFSTLSMVLGIVALLFSIIVAGGLVGIIGVILGFLGIRFGLKRKSFAISGIIFSFTAIVVSVAMGFGYFYVYKEVYKIFKDLSTPEQRPFYAKWIGKKSPDFLSRDLNNNEVRLSNFHSKRVILNFLNANNDTSVKLIKNLVSLRNSIPADNLAIIGISKNSPSELKNLVNRLNINFPLVREKELPLPYSAINRFPTTFSIDRRGIIQNVLVDYLELDALQKEAASPDYMETPFWKVEQFEEIEINDKLTKKYIELLESLTILLMNPISYKYLEIDSNRIKLPATKEDFDEWVSHNILKINKEVLKSPYGIPLEYTLTDGHNSFMLNYYDDNGALWLSYLGGASYREGSIPYNVLRSRGEVIGIAEDNFIWNDDAWHNAVGNLIADAMREEVKADIAIINFLGMRSNISKGPITTALLKRVIPFDNKITVVKMSGKEIVEVCKRSIIYNQPHSVSGISCDNSNTYYFLNKKLDLQRNYNVAISSYMANGGKTWVFASFTDKTRTPVKNILIRDALANYIKHHSPIKPDKSARLGKRKRKKSETNTTLIVSSHILPTIK